MANVIPALGGTSWALFHARPAAPSVAKTPPTATRTPFSQALVKAQTPTAPAAPVRTIGTVTASSTAPVIAPPTTAQPAMPPSAQSLFGPNPWIGNPGGTGPNGGYGYNKYYFATPETAAKVAQMLGGKVVTANALAPSGPFTQNQPNQMVQMPDGRLVNAGIIASYYDHGWPQQMVDRLVQSETTGIS
jgi:hypothetical protein